MLLTGLVGAEAGGALGLSAASGERPGADGLALGLIGGSMDGADG